MPENEPIRRFVPLPTQFLQEEEPSDIDDDDERNADYDQPLAHFQHAAAHSALTSAQDRHVQPFSSGRGISSSSFYGISQRNLNYGQNHSVVDDMPSGQTLRNFMSRSIPNNDDCSQNSYDYQEVFDDPHQLIPSYHEYSITNSPPHSYSPTSGDSAGMPEYFISRMAPTTVRSGGLGYGSHAAEQGDTIYCESQQRLQEPKLPSLLFAIDRITLLKDSMVFCYRHIALLHNLLLQHWLDIESLTYFNAQTMRWLIKLMELGYTVVGHTVEGQPIYALQSVRTQERPRLHQGSVLIPCNGEQCSAALCVLRQQVGPVCRTQRDSTDINSSNENYRAVAREIVAKALEDKVLVVLRENKKKIVTSDNGETEKISGSTVAAQVAAIQRFSTPLGWKQMGSWLKTAEMNEDWSRLKLLLSQCAQAISVTFQFYSVDLFKANLTLELLQSNDTPKFVRKLSKTCPDQDVRKISNDLVICWKRLVSTPPHQVPEELKKSVLQSAKHPIWRLEDLSGNKVECSKKFSSAESSEKSDAGSVKAEKPVKASSSKSNKIEKTEKSSESNKTASSKLNEFNMFEKLGEERKEKKRRPKTAKTYTSKFRSTGLEGDDELAMGKVGASTVAASKKKSSVPASVPKVLPVNTSPPLSSIPFSDKKPTSNTPARVMMSNTFMDALMDPVHKKAPIKQTKNDQRI
ncbi:hypothetical protein DINM_020340 [Dirofilaria immitis]|nr:hypothetical protein [Dirofilaria immitis]